MDKKEKLKDRIYNAIETISTITCSKCRKTSNYYGADGWDAVEPAIREGWYATELNVYCPTCQSKRKK